MNLVEFQNKWRDASLKERSASQEHFIDLCRVLGMPTPAEVDKDGSFYTFEKGASKDTGKSGFADVWYRAHFGWEYKGRLADLNAAYLQLKQYVEALEDPPLLVVCDLYRIEIHTNFTNTRKEIHRFTIDEIDAPAVEGQLSNREKLLALWNDPERLRPQTPITKVTEEAAARFGRLAASLQQRGHDPHKVAHFLMQLLFCLFAEDALILPKGLVARLLSFGAKQPGQFEREVRELLTAMASGGFFNMEQISRFNGGLFAEIDPIPLTGPELQELATAAQLDWSGVEPAIFGTLFERSLDPSKRAQLGAHYTGRADIERVVEPVVMMPLRRRWDEVRIEAEKAKAAWDAATPGTQAQRNRREAFGAVLFGFQEELRKVRILDPACGSGNFLYVALAKLMDLEKEMLVYGAMNGLPLGYPRVEPGQLFGLEINEYARELAQVVVWIGYLKWKLDNGFPGHGDPVLAPLETIKLQDALLDLSDPEHPKEAEWPAADFIIGNPPFLGVRRMRRELRDHYVEMLFGVFEGSVSQESDLICYFFEKARAEIESGRLVRVGLLATNSIRGGPNRKTLNRIKSTGDIFVAWSDEPWVLDGAAVRISIVGFDDGSESSRFLDGVPVSSINPDLTAAIDITVAKRLPENEAIGFMADIKGGPFDIPGSLAAGWLGAPSNPNGRPNSDVVRPWANGLDVTRRSRNMWIIDFNELPEHEAALYEAPFEYAKLHVKPIRDSNRRERRQRLWWIHAETHPAMRKATGTLPRFIATPTVAKHRLFVWLSGNVLADHQLIVFARADDYFFGVLHSRAHEVWSLRMGTWLGVGNDPRYTPTTCFETFPLPWSPGQEPWRDPKLHAIADAARELNEKREAWLNPPGASEAELKKRTLTNLYNERPTWLANLHASLDRAVWAAYGWDGEPGETSDEEILERVLGLNWERAASRWSLAASAGDGRVGGFGARLPARLKPGAQPTKSLRD